EAFAGADLARLAMQNSEVEGEERRDQQHEGKPHPQRLAKGLQEQEVHGGEGPSAQDADSSSDIARRLTGSRQRGPGLRGSGKGGREPAPARQGGRRRAGRFFRVTRRTPTDGQRPPLSVTARTRSRRGGCAAQALPWRPPG